MLPWERVRTMLFWTSAVKGALWLVPVVVVNIPAFLAFTLLSWIPAVFWGSQLPFADATDILLRRVNVAIVASLVMVMIAASVSYMGDLWRAVANLALFTAVVVFVLRLWRECRAY
jgi:hypothetical protein